MSMLVCSPTQGWGIIWLPTYILISSIPCIFFLVLFCYLFIYLELENAKPDVSWKDSFSYKPHEATIVHSSWFLQEYYPAQKYEWSFCPSFSPLFHLFQNFQDTVKRIYFCNNTVLPLNWKDLEVNTKNHSHL